MMVRLVQVMNLRLEFLDAPPRVGAGQLEPARGRVRAAINVEEIPEGAQAGKGQDEHEPEPFLPADGIHDHPKLEKGEDDQERVVQQETGMPDVLLNGKHG